MKIGIISDIHNNVEEVVKKIDEYNYPAKDEIKKFFFGINNIN